MSIYDIGHKDEWGSELLDRKGRVEMWHNSESGRYGVYFFEHVQQYEHWLLFAIRQTKEAGDEVFNKVVDSLENVAISGWQEKLASLLELVNKYKRGWITNDELAEGVGHL